MECGKQSHYQNINYNQNNNISQDVPQAGPCPIDSVTGEPNCPPPTELVCIKTQKVYESCIKELTNEIPVDLTKIAVGDIEDAQCKEPELVINENFPFVCQKLPNTNRARVKFYYRFRFTFLDQENWKQFTSQPIFVEQIVVFSDRILDPRIMVQCEVFLKCTEVIVTEPVEQEVLVCIQKSLVFKLFADVQLLVPAYGFCPEPPECVQPPLIACPVEPLEWPPYPPQPTINDINNNQNNC